MDSNGDTKVFVAQLAFSVDDDQLHEFFSQFGQIVEAKVVMERQYDDYGGNKPRSRGFGFVTYEDVQGAEKAIAEANGAMFADRSIVVKQATPRGPGRNDGGYSRGGDSGYSRGGRGGYRRNDGGEGGYRREGGGEGGYRRNDNEGGYRRNDDAQQGYGNNSYA
ncbi:hypothetical protein H4R19_001298 [Coemansia spiralis]|nr:hypothetical protein H4R19_001298 [Coemansia spiralis]